VNNTIEPLDLQQTLLEYEAILQNASVGILFTRDRKLLHCNPRAAEIFGWPHEEFIGQPGSVLYLSAEDYADIGRVATPILSAGQRFEQERLMRRRDGSTVFCHILAKAINPSNTAEGTIWIAEDIGERKRSETALQELLLKQQAILEHAPVGILFTRNGIIEMASPRMEAIYGWAPGTLVGQRAAVFFETEQEYLAFGAQAGPRLAAGELVDIESRNRRRNGEVLWCRHVAKALSPGSTDHQTIWISEDITERKRIQRALEAAHADLEQRVDQRTSELQSANLQLDAVIQSSPMAIYVRNRDNVVLSWNPAAARIFGWSAEEVLGRPLDNIPADQVAECGVFLQQVLGGETIENLERPRFRKDGSLFEVSLTVAPMRSPDGSIQQYLTLATDVTDRRATEKRVQFLAFHDALTGLPNRLLLQDRLHQAMAQANRDGTCVALMFLDLDNFKQINDTLGHATGDLLLKRVSARLSDCLRDTDTISRQGGDEFVILLSDLPDGRAAVPIVAKIMGRMEEPFNVEGNELATSFSIGVTVYPEDGEDFDTLLKKADMAMYRAKEAGRNGYHFFNEEMALQAGEHLTLRNGLRRALDHNELHLHYQPQIDLFTGEVIGVEALLRWRHPELGPVAPARFIPVAEESGLIVPVGDWVIHEACRQGRAWLDAGLPEITIAINLSAVQFRRGRVEQTVLDALAASGLPAHTLELELTESIMIQNPEQVLAIVQRLKRLGLRLSIDDFGTGYSSLSYLKRFDIDKLKIDQSFLRDLSGNPDDAAIVRAIVQMANSLNLRTIAEGVETAEMALMMREFGCDEAQGYYYARPMPPDELARYLAASVATPRTGAGMPPPV